MAKKMYHCEVCDKPYEQEAEALECEQSHAQEILCKHVKANGKKDECKSTVLINGEVTTVTFEWVSSNKPRTKRFEYESSNVPDVYIDEGEIDDNGHIENS